MSWEAKRQDDVITRTGSALQIDEGLRQYMLKVYNYMTLGLLITALVSYTLAITSLGNLFYQPNGQLNGFGWVAVFAPFIIIFMMGSATTAGNSSKAFVLFTIFSALMGISLTNIFWAYTGTSILRVFLITAGTFAGMSLYGYTTKRDMTSVGHFLIMGLWGVVLASIVNLFLRSSALDMTLSVLGVLVFVGLTAYDTWKIKQMYNSNDAENALTSKAIYGALELYLDFINLFLYMLRFFGDRRN